MTEDTSTSFRLSGSKPLDAKNISLSLNTLIQSIKEDSQLPFSFYKGLKVYLQEEGEDIVWDQVTDSNFENSILEEDFVYPSNVVYEDYDYSGKSFNFFFANSYGNLKGDYGSGLVINNNDQNYL